MIVNLYRSKTPISVFTLPIIVAIGGLSIFFKDVEIPNSLFQWQMDWFQFMNSISWLNYLATLLIISFNAHQLNRVFNANTFFSKDTTLPGLFYVVGVFTLDSVFFSGDLIAHTFIIGALAAFFMIKRQESSKNFVFIGSICIGLSVIFNSYMISLLFLPFLILALIKPFNWREYVICISGLILPNLYHVVLLFLADTTLPSQIFPLTMNAVNDTWTITQSIVYISAIVVSIVGLFSYVVIMRGQVVSFKKLSQGVILILMLSIVASISSFIFLNYVSACFFLPLSIILSVYFLYRENANIAALIVIIWFISSLINLFF